MAEFVIELDPGAEHDEALLPALRDFVACQPPGETRLVVKAHTATGQRELKFGGLIAEPDRDVVEAIVAEHRLTREGETEGSAGRSHD